MSKKPEGANCVSAKPQVYWGQIMRLLGHSGGSYLGRVFRKVSISCSTSNSLERNR